MNRNYFRPYICGIDFTNIRACARPIMSDVNGYSIQNYSAISDHQAQWRGPPRPRNGPMAGSAERTDPAQFRRLFLFDGEKIQNLVEDNAENVYLRDSFKSLLGLDIVDRLKADLLGSYRSSQSERDGTDRHRKKLGRDSNQRLGRPKKRRNNRAGAGPGSESE